MKKNFIIYTFIIFILTSFSIFAEREVDIDKIKYDDKKELGYVNYKDDELDGLIKEYYENGQIKSEMYYKSGNLDGPATEYYENGQVYIQESYKDGELDGESFNFNEDGSLRSKAVYKNGELVGDIVQGGVGSVVAGEVPDTEETSVPAENENVESKLKYYTIIFTFGTVIIGLIAYTIFKIFTAFPKTNNLTDEQRSRIFKILMKHDEQNFG